MCGEIEEDGPSGVEERLHNRFLGHARALMAQYAKAPKPKDENDLHAYMDKLFSDALARAARDARLAGFLAGHMSLQEDPLRKVMEALMLGYGEAEEMTAADHEHGHSHDHEHDHEHSHGHGHDHDHHH